MTHTESLFKTICLLQHLAELQKTDNVDIYYIDLFCGAGGTSTGVELATINGQRVEKRTEILVYNYEIENIIPLNHEKSNKMLRQ